MRKNFGFYGFAKLDLLYEMAFSKKTCNYLEPTNKIAVKILQQSCI